MNKLREISKFVPCPRLTPRLKNLLTELVYLPNHPVIKSDCIFVFGNRNISDTAIEIQKLIDRHVSSLIIISGGLPRFADSDKTYTQPESTRISGLLHLPSKPKTEVRLESTATNTRENVLNSLSLFPTPLSSLTYVCLWYISRRARLSLQKFLPLSVSLFQSALAKKEPGTDIIIHRDNWADTEPGRNRTFAEYLRIKTYGERGDIFYDPATRALVDSITSLL